MQNKLFSFGLQNINFDVIAIPFNNTVWYRAEGVEQTNGAKITLDLGAGTNDRAELIERAMDVLNAF